MNISENEAFEDIISRDRKSQNFINEAIKISKKIDTTDLNIEESLEEIMRVILHKTFLTRYKKIIKVLFLIFIIIVANFLKM